VLLTFAALKSVVLRSRLSSRLRNGMEVAVMLRKLSIVTALLFANLLILLSGMGAPTASAVVAPTPKISPIVECVVNNGDGTFDAYFGYNNSDTAAVVVEIGGSNKFTPAPENRGQPTTFQPGRSPFWPNAAFVVEDIQVGSTVVWSLTGRTATAGAGGTPCSNHVFFDKAWIDFATQQPGAVPQDLPANFSFVATSTLGTATCSYAGDDLTCVYANQKPPALDNLGLWVPVGNPTFTVVESNAPAGWQLAKSSFSVPGDVACNYDPDGEATKYSAQTKFCLATLRNEQQPGTLVVEKITVPTEATEAFSFTVKLDDSVIPGGAFDLGSGDVVTLTVAPNSYVVGESTKPDWELTSVVCEEITEGLVGPDALPVDPPAVQNPITVAVGANETWKCTFTNDFIEQPSIVIKKYTNGEDADVPTGPVVPVGSTVTWTYVVTNTGNVPLSAVAVNDSDLGAITCPANSLAVGATMTCSATGLAVAGQYANLGDVTGTDPTGKQVVDDDPSHYFGAADEPELAGLGNRVWNDVNNNGIQDDGESGVAGVTVNLLDSGNNVLATTTTDASGLYTFTNLAPGSYVVEFVKPAGTLFSPQFQGGDPAKDSNANPTTGKSDLVTLVAGQFDETIDAGLFTPSVEPELASLGDRVWLDANQNGVQDDGESGVAGVLVTLYRENGEEVATDTTDGAGNYLFTNLPPGSYYVHFARPQGYVFTRYNVGDPAQDSNAQVPTLALQVTTPLAEVALGGVLSYTLTYANAAGQPTATGVVLSATVPAGTTFLPGASTAGWVCADDSTAAGTPCTLTVAEVTAGTQAQVLFVVQLGTDDAQVPDAINLAVTIDQATPGRTGVVTLAAGEQNLTIDAGIYLQAVTVTETPRRPGPTNLDPGAQPLGRNKIYLPAVQN
jgi:uncharacterized repeat protein (TIGR01451 family)